MKTTIALFATLLSTVTLFAEDVKPLKVLLLAGGCCHKYGEQKGILKEGLEARANVIVDIVYSADTTTKPPLEVYGKADYAKGYDVVLHDECSANQNDPELIKAVLQPHVDGIPGVNLHCAMHSYRFGDFKKPVAAGADNAHWYEYIGLQSTAHGAQQPIAISFIADANSPITKGMADWTTINEELYNNIQIFPTAKALARGKQGAADNVVAWTNEFGPKKTRVFSTTIGHNTDTVSDDRYLDLVTRGVLWAAGKLGDDGKPVKGYEAKAK